MNKEAFERGFCKRAEAYGINQTKANTLLKEAGPFDTLRNMATNMGDSIHTGWHNAMDNPIVHGANAAWSGMTSHPGGFINPANSVANPWNWDKMKGAYHESHQDSLRSIGDAYGQQYGHRLSQGDMQNASEAAKSGIGAATQVDDRKYRMGYGNNLNTTRTDIQNRMDTSAQNRYTDQKINGQLTSFNPLPHNNIPYTPNLPQMGMQPNASNNPSTINPNLTGIPAMAPARPQHGGSQTRLPRSGGTPGFLPPTQQTNGGGMPRPHPQAPNGQNTSYTDDRGFYHPHAPRN